jgi:hypothetical protein
MQSRVERAMFNLEDILGPAFDGMGNSMTVGWAKDQRLEHSMSSVPMGTSLFSGDSLLGIRFRILQ